MAIGSERREDAPDSLVGAAGITPTQVQSPQLQIPNASVPDVINSTSSQMMRSLSKWAGSRIQESANKQHEASVLDGQMAYQQGKAMEDLDMGGGMFGDKWAMQGYRVMEAQTLASTMMASQRQMIQQVQFEQDPDTFRATYVAQMEEQIDGLDPQTAKMVREQMAEHMPTLVAEHTTKFMQNEEQNAYSALVNLVGPASQDPTAFDTLMNNSEAGPASGSNGLSSNRRRSALVEGTIGQFDRDNPVAFQQLKSSGRLDELPDAERNSLLAAQQRYEQRMRAVPNQVFTEEMAEFSRDLESAEFGSDYASMYDSLSSIYAKQGFTLKQAEVGQAYSVQLGNNDLQEQAEVTNIAAAQARQDWASVADQTVGLVLQAESGGDFSAVGPLITGGANKGTRAQGGMQVMPLTMADPGFGIRPSDGTPADTRRVGREYWAMNVARFKGDIESAAIGYNAGPGNADKFYNGWTDEDENSPTFGQSWPPRSWEGLEAAGVKVSETRPYAEGIAATAQGGDLYYTSSQELSLSRTGLENATALREQLMETQDIQSFEDYSIALSDHTQLFKDSSMTPEQYRTGADAIRATHEIAQTRAMVTQQVALVGSVVADRTTRRSEEADDLHTESRAAWQVSTIEASARAIEAMGAEDATPTSIQQAYTDFEEEIMQSAAVAGVVLSESGMETRLRAMEREVISATGKMHDRNVENETISAAIQTGSVNELSGALRGKAWDTIRENRARSVAASLPSNASTEVQQAAANTATMDSWKQAGEVDPQVTSRNSAIINNGQSLAGDGTANPAFVSVVEQYQDMLRDSPYLAKTFLNEAAQVRANVVMSLGSGNIVEGTLNLNHKIEEQDRRYPLMTADKRAVVATDGAIQAAQREDVGMWQAMLTNATLGQMWTTTGDEFRDRESAAREIYAPLVEEVMQTLSVRHDMPADQLLSMAMAQVDQRVSFLGGSVVVYEDGNDFLTQALGSRADTVADAAGIEDEIFSAWLINNAANVPGLGEITEITVAEGGVTQRLGSATLDLIPNAFGFDFFDSPAMNTLDAQGALSKGTRPYKVQVIGGETFVRYLRITGEMSEFIPVDVQQAGAEWLAREKTHATQ